MNRLLAVLLLVAGVALTPGFALAEGAAAGKPLTSIEFAEHFRGLDSKLVDRQYVEYRNGMIPAPTLDASNTR